MKTISNKIINQYLDNELSSDNKQSVKKILAQSEKENQNFKLLYQLDKNLRKMKSNRTSPSFTIDLMEKLYSSTTQSAKLPKFVIFSISLLVIPLLLMLGTVVYNIFSKSNITPERETIMYSINEIIILGYEKFLYNFNLNPLSILWISLAFLLSILLYFLIEELNRSKKLLEQIQ